MDTKTIVYMLIGILASDTSHLHLIFDVVIDGLVDVVVAVV